MQEKESLKDPQNSFERMKEILNPKNIYNMICMAI